MQNTDICHFASPKSDRSLQENAESASNPSFSGGGFFDVFLAGGTVGQLDNGKLVVVGVPGIPLRKGLLLRGVPRFETQKQFTSSNLGTNISHFKAVLKMIFFCRSWDMLVFRGFCGG